MPIITANGIDVYHEVHGQGEPLILISGLGGDHFFWTTMVSELAGQHQLILLDNRGIGQSSIPDTPYTIERMAGDVAGLMDGLGLERAHVLGFSMGGNIAQSFALDHPDRVKKLMICASYATMNTQARLFLDAVLSVYEGGATPRQFYELILPWLFSTRFLEDPANIGDLAFNPDDPYPQPLHGFKRQYEAQRIFDSRPRLHEIRAETLVVTGEGDHLVSVEDARILARSIPGAALEIIPGAGHLFNVEEPARFLDLVRSFLQP